MSKYYVVWIGRKPGIYNNWPDAQEQIHRFKGARHQSFETRAEAVEAFKVKPIHKLRPFKKLGEQQSSTIKEMHVILARLVTKLRNHPIK